MAATRGRRRILLSTGVAACVVLLAFTATALLAGCSRHQISPLAAITPGPRLPARPGAHVWVVGLPDVVLGSADGGASWKLAHRGEFTSDSLADLWDVAFGDAAHGWAIERGSPLRPAQILATTDGGATWSWQHPGPSGKLLAVAATDARHAWAVGYQAHSALVLATTDGGAPGGGRRSPATSSSAMSPSATRVTAGPWAVPPDQFANMVFSTADGGAHWRLSYSTKTAQLSRLAGRGARRCWVVGSRRS